MTSERATRRTRRHGDRFTAAPVSAVRSRLPRQPQVLSALPLRPSPAPATVGHTPGASLSTRRCGLFGRRLAGARGLRLLVRPPAAALGQSGRTARRWGEIACGNPRDNPAYPRASPTSPVGRLAVGSFAGTGHATSARVSAALPSAPAAPAAVIVSSPADSPAPGSRSLASRLCPLTRLRDVCIETHAQGSP